MANKRQNPDNPLTNGKLSPPTTEPQIEVEAPLSLDENGNPSTEPTWPSTNPATDPDAKQPPPDKDADLRAAKEAMEAQRALDRAPVPRKHPSYDGPSLGAAANDNAAEALASGLTLKPNQMIAHRGTLMDLLDFARMVSTMEAPPQGKVFVTMREHAARVVREAMAMNKGNF